MRECPFEGFSVKGFWSQMWFESVSGIKMFAVSEFYVKAFCFDVGVTRGEATEAFCGLVIVFPFEIFEMAS